MPPCQPSPVTPESGVYIRVLPAGGKGDVRAPLVSHDLQHVSVGLPQRRPSGGSWLVSSSTAGRRGSSGRSSSGSRGPYTRTYGARQWRVQPSREFVTGATRVAPGTGEGDEKGRTPWPALTYAPLTRTMSNWKYQIKALEALIRKLPDPSSPAPPQQRPTPPNRSRQLKETEAREVIAAYQAGATAYQLGQRFEISRHTVSKILKRHGIKLRRTRPVTRADPPSHPSLRRRLVTSQDRRTPGSQS